MIIYRFFLIIIAAVCISCSEEIKPNKVDLNQVEPDGSTDDRYLFRKEIKEQEWRDKRYKKDTF